LRREGTTSRAGTTSGLAAAAEWREREMLVVVVAVRRKWLLLKVEKPVTDHKSRKNTCLFEQEGE